MMKKIKYIPVALGLIFGTMSVSAQQQTYEIFSGYLLSRTNIGVTDMVSMSQNNNSVFGTARSTAMGGAFTSLGADLSSMNINPAGLGMYRSSEIGFTPAVTIGKMDNKYPTGVNMSDSKTRFSLNNIGIALNLYQGSGGLTSFTMGFGYNKLADFNYRSVAMMPTDDIPIAAVFQQQLRGMPVVDLDKGFLPKEISRWGSAMAYNTFMLEHDIDGFYDIRGMDAATNKSHLLNTDSKGSIGEYSIAGGFNVRNKFYIGFSVGIQDINIKQTIGYNEDYSNNSVDPAKDRLTNMFYQQQVKIQGTGVDFKLGVIIRPIPELRIGVAAHTPKFYGFDKKYQTYMTTGFAAPGDEGTSSEWSRSDVALTDHDFNSPARLMTGISYTIAQRAILSVDYERTWYNGMRLRIKDGSIDAIKNENLAKEDVKSLFKGANTYRAGLEIMATDLVSLRAGFSYADSPLKDDNQILDSPVAKETYSISGGVGLRLGRRASLDLTYSYMDTKFSKYQMFSYEKRTDDANNTLLDAIFLGESDNGITQQLKRHNIIGTISFRF